MVPELPLDRKTLMRLGPLWIGFLVMLGMLLGFIDSPITRNAESLGKVTEKLETVRKIHDRQTRLLRAICRQGAKSELSLRECNEEESN